MPTFNPKIPTVTVQVPIPTPVEKQNSTLSSSGINQNQLNMTNHPQKLLSKNDLLQMKSPRRPKSLIIPWVS